MKSIVEIRGHTVYMPTPFASTFKNRTISARSKFLKELTNPTQERISIFFSTALKN